MENIIKESIGAWAEGMAKNITFIVTKALQLACKYCYLVGKHRKGTYALGKLKKGQLTTFLIMRTKCVKKVLYGISSGESLFWR